MSFIRAGEQDSDVYVYPGSYADGREYFMCCTALDTKAEMRAHLDEHRADGYCVPDKAYRELDEWDYEALKARLAASTWVPGRGFVGP